MNDDEVLEECLRLLRDGLPDPAPATFDEGRGFLPLGLDIDGDVAVVTFLYRSGDVSSGCADFIEGWTFHRREGEWRELGGGGGSAPAEPLTRRSSMEMGRHLLKYGSGRTVRNANRLLPWGAKWVNQARLHAAAEVARIRIGQRLLDVPAHGHAVVVWGARRGPIVEALAPDGSVLDALDLNTRLARPVLSADI
ncbi:hypothetical protein BZB76_5813 [Actinomadura pelletieri DSM 43383]|uniref:Uncharacterized protein n=1 Tax=Actinomadura pelletieri DSM 43383 TaxID=1120940 RepID=A0A495QAI0_9ACTN|nr:hypothetical protein [Actinomadura pelletieri]RKS68689.1 hypothetical protein BZB76_5813 [Actinomadura pelletieri DSM 43383]